MQSRMRIFTWALLGATLAACTTPRDRNDDDDDDDDEGLSSAEAAVLAMSAEALPRVHVEEQLDNCIAVAAAAAQLTGSNDFVVSGTVDATTGTYSSQPSDALVLREEGRETRFVITALAVAAVDTLEEVFVNDHDVRCRATRSNAFDLTMESSLQGGSGSRSASGTVEASGRELNVNVEESRSSVGFLDNQIFRGDTTVSRSGTISGRDVDVSYTDDETAVFLVGEGGVFENFTTDVTLDATVEGIDFTMSDGVIRRSFANGAPDELDFWAETRGTLARNGSAFGTLTFRQSGAFEIVLELPDETEVIESYLP